MIVSNATPLIYLAKIEKLELLKKIYKTILISEEVRQEVVDRGKQLGKKDAYIIEKAVQEGWILEEKTNKIKIPIELDTGEASTISLAKSKNVKEVLIDETSGRTAAKLVGLEPRGTVFVLLKSLEKKIINFEDFLYLMKRLTQEGFRLKEEVYISAIEKARDMSK